MLGNLGMDQIYHIDGFTDAEIDSQAAQRISIGDAHAFPPARKPPLLAAQSMAAFKSTSSPVVK
jgi:hypothetical protein